MSHSIGQKDELLKLYARDAHETEMNKELVEEGEESSPGWVHALAEECHELRESNLVLKAETQQLRKETAEIEQKEKELVQNCLEQFSKYTSCYKLIFELFKCVHLNTSIDS